MKFKIPAVAFLVPFLILLIGFRLVVFDVSFYKSEFEKYGVYEKFDKEEVVPVVENLTSYIKSNTPLSDFFNEKEKLHMADVRNIIQKVFLTLYLLLSVIVISLISSRKYFFKSLFYGGLLSLAFLILLFILCFTSFDFIFYKFHELSFSNDFWRLDPEVDNLKALMADKFFYDALLRIFFISSIISFVSFIIGASGLKVINVLEKSREGSVGKEETF